MSVSISLLKAEKVAMARLDLPSEQDWKRVSDAATLIDAYQFQLSQFEILKWNKFIKVYKKGTHKNEINRF